MDSKRTRSRPEVNQKWTGSGPEVECEVSISAGLRALKLNFGGRGRYICKRTQDFKISILTALKNFHF